MPDQSDAIADAAGASDAPFISPLDEGWFDEAIFDTLMIEDGTHLNNDGHAVFADRFLADLRDLAGE